jgi:ligand-binding sensor domain-containing protein
MRLFRWAANIWTGTENSGLWKIDHGLSKIKIFTTKDGFTSKSISQVNGDERGHVWLNTNSGIYAADPKTGRFVNYGAEDNLNITSAAYLVKKSSGGVFCVDINGFYIFNSSVIDMNKEPPPVCINYFRY